MDEIELKPCPFCGGKAVHEAWVDVTPVYDENGAYVDADTFYFEKTGCPTCDIWFFISEDEEEESTVKAWNRRVKDG